eukprot:6373085-Pyramimonas_sp.AAC.1
MGGRVAAADSLGPGEGLSRAPLGLLRAGDLERCGLLLALGRLERLAEPDDVADDLVVMVRCRSPGAVGFPRRLDLAVLDDDGLGGAQPLRLGVEDRLHGR